MSTVRLQRPLAITAAGLTTSVGRTRAAACAAIRAGLTRPTSSNELLSTDIETLEMIPLVSHPVRDLATGFFRVGRWVRLACDALEDMRVTSGEMFDDPQHWLHTALLIATRPINTEWMMLDDTHSDADALEKFRVEIGDALIKEAHLRLAPSDIRIVPDGHAGVASALGAAVALLEGHDYKRVLVLAVDSWFDPALLGDAMEEQRVKGDGGAIGFAPGEAAAALMLEGSVRAHHRGGPILGLIAGVAADHAHRRLVEKPNGIALFSCLNSIVEEVATDGFEGDIFVDLNGEEWRAAEWGNAMTRLGGKLERSRSHVPATSIGDVGAASGAVGVCLALEAHRRNWSRAPVALVVSVSDSGQTGCVAVARMN